MYPGIVIDVLQFRESNFFGEMCVDAAQLVKVTDGSGKVLYPIQAINILKAHGKSAKESRLIQGYAINCTRASDGTALCLVNVLCALWCF